MRLRLMLRFKRRMPTFPKGAKNLVGALWTSLGGGRTRTSDLRIMRCGFRWAATRIQALTVGTGHLIWDPALSFGT
jgi:hypothetical protein